MSTTVACYGEWDVLYANALLEPDKSRLPARITAAETAINERLKALSNRDTPEKSALVDALCVLERLRGSPKSFLEPH